MIGFEPHRHVEIKTPVARALCRKFNRGGRRHIIYRHAKTNMVVFARLVSGCRLLELKDLPSWPHVSQGDLQDLHEQTSPNEMTYRRNAKIHRDALRAEQMRTMQIGEKHRKMCRQARYNHRHKADVDHPFFNPPDIGM